MQGDARVVEYLNRGLRHELAAINQYWLHYRLLDNWGYRALAKKWRKELIEEMEHADKIVERIIFLDGFPNMQVIDPLRIGQNVKEVLDCDLAAECRHVALSGGRIPCHPSRIHVTRDLFENAHSSTRRSGRYRLRSSISSLMPGVFLRGEYEFVASPRCGTCFADDLTLADWVSASSSELTAPICFLMSGRGTPLPTEGRLSGRVDHDQRDARRAAARSALLVRPLRQAPRLEPLSPHRRSSRTLAPIEDRQGEAQARHRSHPRGARGPG